MKRAINKVIAAVTLCLIPLVAAAASAPKWVSKGVKSLNKERSNTSYEFVALETYGLELNQLESNGTDALKKYLEENVYAKPRTISVDTIRKAPSLQFKLTFETETSEDNYVIAELVDTYTTFDDFAENAYEFQYYQLYAVGRPNTIPQYDNFSLTNSYNSHALVLSLVPGLGQFYKCQNDKAYVIIGSEVALLGAALVFDNKARYCHKQRPLDEYLEPSWRSKEKGWTNFRTGALCCAGAMYLYNLIDAAVAKGARQVIVSKPKGVKWSMTPYADLENVGLAMQLTF